MFSKTKVLICILFLQAMFVVIVSHELKAANLLHTTPVNKFDGHQHSGYQTRKQAVAKNVNIGIYPRLPAVSYNMKQQQYYPYVVPYPVPHPSPIPYIQQPQQQIIKQKIIKNTNQKALPPRIIAPNIKIPVSPPRRSRVQNRNYVLPPLPPLPLPQQQRTIVRPGKTVYKTKKIVQKIIEPDYPFYFFARGSHAFYDTPPQFHVRSSSYTENWSREKLSETPSFEAGVGKVFSRFLRAEIFGGVKMKADIEAYNLAQTTEKITTSISMFYGYGNLYGTFLRTKAFNLYLGAGAGLVSYKLSALYNTTSKSIIYNGSNGTKFIFNLTAGSYFKISDSFGIDLAYRYVNMGEIPTSATNDARVYLKNINYHEGMLGVRVNF